MEEPILPPDQTRSSYRLARRPLRNCILWILGLCIAVQPFIVLAGIRDGAGQLDRPIDKLDWQITIVTVLGFTGIPMVLLLCFLPKVLANGFPEWREPNLTVPASNGLDGP